MHLLADVFPSEGAAAGVAFETADVPLSLQSQERLTLFNLRSATRTV